MGGGQQWRPVFRTINPSSKLVSPTYKTSAWGHIRKGFSQSYQCLPTNSPAVCMASVISLNWPGRRACVSVHGPHPRALQSESGPSPFTSEKRSEPSSHLAGFIVCVAFPLPGKLSSTFPVLFWAPRYVDYVAPQSDIGHTQITMLYGKSG